MINTHAKLFFKQASLGLTLFTLLALAPAANAITVGFDLNITITETNPNVGTGVTDGDTFTGVMFFDSIDLTPDGSRTRTVIPGGDSITIAGLTFDYTLANTFYGFTFSGGVPLCIGDSSLDGCSTGEGQSIPKPNGDDLIFYDDFTGRVRDSTSDDPLGPFQFASFTYTFSESVAVAEPSVLALLSLGLFGFGVARKSIKKY